MPILGLRLPRPHNWTRRYNRYGCNYARWISVEPSTAFYPRMDCIQCCPACDWRGHPLLVISSLILQHITTPIYPWMLYDVTGAICALFTARRQLLATPHNTPQFKNGLQAAQCRPACEWRGYPLVCRHPAWLWLDPDWIPAMSAWDGLHCAAWFAALYRPADWHSRPRHYLPPTMLSNFIWLDCVF